MLRGVSNTLTRAVLIVFGPNALFFLTQVAPNFIALNVTNCDVPNVSAHDLFTLLASDHQKLQDRVPVKLRHSFYAADAGTLKEHPKGKDGLLQRDRHRTEKILVGFGVRPAALGTTKTAQSVPMLTETGAADFAVRAVHFGLRFGHRFHILIIQETLAVIKALMFAWAGFSSGDELA